MNLIPNSCPSWKDKLKKGCVRLFLSYLPHPLMLNSCATVGIMTLRMCIIVLLFCFITFYLYFFNFFRRRPEFSEIVNTLRKMEPEVSKLPYGWTNPEVMLSKGIIT